MISKVVLLFCAQTLSANYISCQCIGATHVGAGVPWRPAPWTATLPYTTETPIVGTPVTATERTGFTPATLAASNGGGFSITSYSPIIPTGLIMKSENEYEGPVVVSGAVPFLGALALEGVLPTAGTGTVNYGCENGNVAMLSEDITAGFNGYGPYGYGPGINAAEFGYGYPSLAYEAGVAGPGYGYGFNRGCGCGAIY